MISIGLPIYNAQYYLKNTITSIINQSYRNWELIALDDGSSDMSLEIVKSFKDERIKIYSDGLNLGLAKRLNQSIRLSNEKYYCRIDSDDIMHPERLMTQLSFLESNPKIDVIGSGAYIIDNENNITGIRYGSEEFNTIRAISGSLFLHPTCMGRTSWFIENSYNESSKRSEDYQLWIESVGHSRFYNLRNPLIFYREVGLAHGKKYSRTSEEIIDYLIDSELKFDPVFSPYVIEKIRRTQFSNKIFSLLARMGLEKRLITRRSRSLNPHEANTAKGILNQAISLPKKT